ncbi:MAG: AEC family transporter [Beijerinckiaceae bacterium]|nr:AEC family transporter [Beijerinckiaceae bacterium]
MQVISVIFNVVAPVFIIIGIGYAWARAGKPYDSNVITHLVNTISTPCLVIDILTRPGLTIPALGEIGVASALCLLLSGLAGWGMTRTMGLPARTYVPPLVWSNGGNMGLPLCLFAFGELGLGLAIAWFAVSSISNYTIGQAIAAGGITFREVVRMPMTWAILAAVTMIATGLQLPTVAQRAVNLLGALTVPLMLLSLGYALHSLRVASYQRSIVFSVARLMGGFVIGWFVAWLLGLEGAARGVVVIQSGMPAAVLNYLFAARYGNDPQEAASIVVISTLLSVAVLPLFLLTVI